MNTTIAAELNSKIHVNSISRKKFRHLSKMFQVFIILNLLSFFVSSRKVVFSLQRGVEPAMTSWHGSVFVYKKFLSRRGWRGNSCSIVLSHKNQTLESILEMKPMRKARMQIPGPFSQDR